MAHIAHAAGVSRPALYQYFSDKDDIFAAAFAGVFEEHVERSLAALNKASAPKDALANMLQRFEGDLWELTSSSPHHQELLQAKSSAVAAAVGVEVVRLWNAVSDYLASQAPGRGVARMARRGEWLDVLRGSPAGLRFDSPTVDVFRQRLNALARAVSADLTAEVRSARRR